MQINIYKNKQNVEKGASMIGIKKRTVPLVFKITLPIFIFCLVLHFVTELSTPFADLMNSTVCAYYREIMGKISDFIPLPA